MGKASDAQVIHWIGHTYLPAVWVWGLLGGILGGT